MGIETIVGLYFIIINLISYITMGADKKKAKLQQYRISEKTLWTLAWIGGGTGAYAGMKGFRHKTKHNTFRLGLPVLMMLQLASIIYLFI